MSILLMIILVGCQIAIIKTNDGSIKEEDQTEEDQIEEVTEDSNQTTQTSYFIWDLICHFACSTNTKFTVQQIRNIRYSILVRQYILRSKG